jgi:hypothetical protein
LCAAFWSTSIRLEDEEEEEEEEEPKKLALMMD